MKEEKELQLTQAPASETQGSPGFLVSCADPQMCGHMARFLSDSKIVPDLFKQDVGACLLALNMAQRLGCDPFMVMQNLYNVKGNVCLSGKFCAAMLFSTPRYQRVSYEFVNGVDWKQGVYVKAVRQNGVEENGVSVTPEMVRGEGWDKNPKWQTMPEQMYRYRAAAFFVRTFCPDLLCGMQTVEEVRDFTGAYAAHKGSANPPKQPKQPLPQPTSDPREDLFPDVVDVPTETAYRD